MRGRPREFSKGYSMFHGRPKKYTLVHLKANKTIARPLCLCQQQVRPIPGTLTFPFKRGFSARPLQKHVFRSSCPSQYHSFTACLYIIYKADFGTPCELLIGGWVVKGGHTEASPGRTKGIRESESRQGQGLSFSGNLFSLVFFISLPLQLRLRMILGLTA